MKPSQHIFISSLIGSNFGENYRLIYSMLSNRYIILEEEVVERLLCNNFDTIKYKILQDLVERQMLIPIGENEITNFLHNGIAASFDSKTLVIGLNSWSENFIAESSLSKLYSFITTFSIETILIEYKIEIQFSSKTLQVLNAYTDIFLEKGLKVIVEYKIGGHFLLNSNFDQIFKCKIVKKVQIQLKNDEVVNLTEESSFKKLLLIQCVEVLENLNENLDTVEIIFENKASKKVLNSLITLWQAIINNYELSKIKFIFSLENSKLKHIRYLISNIHFRQIIDYYSHLNIDIFPFIKRKKIDLYYDTKTGFVLRYNMQFFALNLYNISSVQSIGKEIYTNLHHECKNCRLLTMCGGIHVEHWKGEFKSCPPFKKDVNDRFDLFVLQTLSKIKDDNTILE